MEMTIWVCQGQSHLPAAIPGITTVLGQRGRLQPKGRLRQQPAGDFTVGSPSRRRRPKSSNGCFTKSSVAPTRSTEAGDKHDASQTRRRTSLSRDVPLTSAENCFERWLFLSTTGNGVLAIFHIKQVESGSKFLKILHLHALL
jgi:hypothetical protein